MPQLVMHLTTAHPRFDNRIFRKECTALARHGYSVTLIAPGRGDETRGGVTVKGSPEHRHRLPRMTLGVLTAASNVLRSRPALVHAHDPELIPALTLLRGATRLLGWRTKFIYDAHESLPAQVRGKPYLNERVRPLVAVAARALEIAAGRLLDGVVAATPEIARSYPSRRTAIVQNFPWLEDYPAASPYPHRDGPLRAVYVGGISRSRGSRIMRDACRNADERVHLTLAGPLEEGAILDIEGDNISYLGRLAAEEIPELIGSSHVGLCLLEPLHNYVKSQPTKLFEYMAAGRPFIASDFPAWRELFAATPGEQSFGYFVDPHDKDAIAAALGEVAGNFARAERMGLAGRMAIERKFSFEREAQKLAAFYTTILQDSGASCDQENT